MDQPIDLSLEAPLEGLLAKPRHLLSEAELRERIAKLHEQRTSSQAFQAMVRSSTGVKEEKVKEKQVAFGDFE